MFCLDSDAVGSVVYRQRTHGDEAGFDDTILRQSDGVIDFGWRKSRGEEVGQHEDVGGQLRL